MRLCCCSRCCSWLGVSIEVQVVGRPGVFPGLGYLSTRPLVVLASSVLRGRGAQTETELWLDTDGSTTLDQVRAAGLSAPVVRRATARVDGSLEPQLWALDFLRVLGAITGAVALCGLGLYYAAIVRRRLVGDSLLARLGASTTNAVGATAAEVGGMLLVGLALGVASAWLALVATYAKLDPAPGSRPGPLLRYDAATVLAGFAVAVAAAVGVAAALNLRRRLASLDGVLRHAG